MITMKIIILTAWYISLSKQTGQLEQLIMFNGYCYSTYDNLYKNLRIFIDIVVTSFLQLNIYMLFI